eukprot:11879381-Karenia_brevis.AAC.1
MDSGSSWPVPSCGGDVEVVSLSIGDCAGVGVGVEVACCWGVALSCVVLGADGSVVGCAGVAGVGGGPWAI